MLRLAAAVTAAAAAAVTAAAAAAVAVAVVPVPVGLAVAVAAITAACATAPLRYVQAGIVHDQHHRNVRVRPRLRGGGRPRVQCRRQAILPFLRLRNLRGHALRAL